MLYKFFIENFIYSYSIQMSDLLLQRTLQRGAIDARTLARELGISQPTLSRRLKPLIRNGEVVKIGAGRASRYAWRRMIPALPETEALPLYEIDETGEAQIVGELTPLEPGGTVITGELNGAWLNENRKLRIHEGLPFYLEYLRPEGFLGRLFCRQIATHSGLPPDPQSWDEDQLLSFLCFHSADLPGSLIVGRHSLDVFLRSTVTPIKKEQIIGEYHRLAESVLSGETPGSSAGGEQPKFTAFIAGEKGGPPKHMIVKFSPAGDDRIARRWRDLLVAEHRALSLLNEYHSFPNPVSLITVRERSMLQIERYDRVGEKGRRPWISLGALDDELFGRRDSIRAALRRLQRIGLLSEEDAGIGMVASLFGDFIGNTDQHFGNLSFTREEDRIRIGPLYDILPMFYAPRRGGEIVDEKAHSLPVRIPEEKEYFEIAAEIASDYWNLLAGNGELSEDFHRIARRTAELMK